jgi:hypothetical protein
VNMAKC